VALGTTKLLRGFADISEFSDCHGFPFARFKKELIPVTLFFILEGACFGFLVSAFYRRCADLQDFFSAGVSIGPALGQADAGVSDKKSAVISHHIHPGYEPVHFGFRFPG